MLLIEYVGHIGLRSLTDGHLGRHLEYFKTLNDARVASVEFIKYNASTTRINKEKIFKIKFQVILVFYLTRSIPYKNNHMFPWSGGCHIGWSLTTTNSYLKIWHSFYLGVQLIKPTLSPYNKIFSKFNMPISN